MRWQDGAGRLSPINPARVQPEDDIGFLIATPKRPACQQPAHAAFTRRLQRLEPNSDDLWSEASPQVDLADGILVIDDSTLDKSYSKSIDMVSRHWPGKHHGVVEGISLVTLLWTDGDRHVTWKNRPGTQTTVEPQAFGSRRMLEAGGSDASRPQITAISAMQIV